MNLAIDLTLKASDDKPACCHLIPCEIHHSGEGNMSKFFQPAIQQGPLDVLEASFRGRPLQGKMVPVPEGYTGVVLQEASGDASKWRIAHRFDEFTYWNWDKQPSANDKITQALAWLHIASAINSTDEETDGKGDV